MSFEGLEFRPARVMMTAIESQRVKSILLESNGATPRPGQFMMVWIPGWEEVPMSVSDGGDGFIRISVASLGRTTAGIHGLGRGDMLFIRGPFGNGFSLGDGSFLLVGGGYGAAPLIYAAKALSWHHAKWAYLIGAKRRSELLFLDEALAFGVKGVVATDDGSAGHRGPITDLVEGALREGKFDSILTCGPERMMYKVVVIGARHGVRVQASLERYMKCGFGICGSCVLGPVGARACTEGPIFDGEFLLNTEFGGLKLDAAGVRLRV